VANEYVNVNQLKTTLGITVSTFDTDITNACAAASRGIDRACSRRFWLDSGTNNIRYYQGNPQKLILGIDDLVTVTTIKLDTDGDATFSTTLTANTDYVLDPLNAAVESPARPYTRLVLNHLSSYSYPSYVRSVKITGAFGWATVPDEIVRATTILAIKLFKRQETPFGVLSVGVDQPTAMRIAQSDPDVRFLIGPYLKMAI